jgi:membrane fusion protein (multidrug efflux system)
MNANPRITIAHPVANADVTAADLAGEARPDEPASRSEPGGPEVAVAAEAERIEDNLKPRRDRARLRSILMLGGIAIVVVGAAVMWLRGGRYVSSDDAYIHAAKLMVSTDVSGIVSSVDVKQGQHVKAGDVLFRLDPAPFQTALDAAKAQLDEAKLTLEAARQDYTRIGLDIAAQQAVVEQDQANYDRTAALIRSNAASKASFDQARFTLQTDQKKLDSLRQQQKVALTRLGGDIDKPIEQLPQYRQAETQVAEAQRQLDHSVVRAPFSGVVTEVASLQPGTYLVSQTAALTNTGAVGLVSTDNVWVDANLKETDLTYTKPGDTVDVSVDAYPGRVWKGKIESIYPATGSEFSILPAQNASGNWVKVVQRIPVRISLQHKPGDPVLRAGMSVTADIDTGHTRSVADLWGGHAGTANAASR